MEKKEMNILILTTIGKTRTLISLIKDTLPVLQPVLGFIFYVNVFLLLFRTWPEIKKCLLCHILRRSFCFLSNMLYKKQTTQLSVRRDPSLKS